MDLLATVRKEGSRGGTGDFKWSDVQASSRRENYLGHSLMAPVGRWQKGRDLNWYAKSGVEGENGDDQEAKAAWERKEELRRVKEAEEDAMARALGLPVPDRNNPNLQALGDKKAVDKVLKDVGKDETPGNERGIGYGATSDDTRMNAADEAEAEAEVVTEFVIVTDSVGDEIQVEIEVEIVIIAGSPPQNTIAAHTGGSTLDPDQAQDQDMTTVVDFIGVTEVVHRTEKTGIVKKVIEGGSG